MDSQVIGKGARSVMQMLKLALTCVLAGGSSAAVVGRLEAKGVEAQLIAHESGSHPKTDAEIASLKQEFIAQASEARQAAQQAAYDSNRSAAMLEVLLLKEGITLPPAPPRPVEPPDAGADAGFDAGSSAVADAGAHDAGRRRKDAGR